MSAGVSTRVPPGGPLPDIMAGSDAQKSSNKPISEYFPKRAPSSPVRGGTKSPLSFGSMYPQSPKTSYVASSPSGNASNGPMSYNQGDYYQQHPQQPGDYLSKIDFFSKEAKSQKVFSLESFPQKECQITFALTHV